MSGPISIEAGAELEVANSGNYYLYDFGMLFIDTKTCSWEVQLDNVTQPGIDRLLKEKRIMFVNEFFLCNHHDKKPDHITVVIDVNDHKALRNTKEYDRYFPDGQGYLKDSYYLDAHKGIRFLIEASGVIYFAVRDEAISLACERMTARGYSLLGDPKDDINVNHFARYLMDTERVYSPPEEHKNIDKFYNFSFDIEDYCARRYISSPNEAISELESHIEQMYFKAEDLCKYFLENHALSNDELIDILTDYKIKIKDNEDRLAFDVVITQLKDPAKTNVQIYHELYGDKRPNPEVFIFRQRERAIRIAQEEGLPIPPKRKRSRPPKTKNQSR